MRKVTKLWQCKDGTKIPICDMTDSHLLNAMRFLEKRVPFPEPAMFQGEMAQYYADQEYDRLCMMSVEDLTAEAFPIYEDLEAEWSRRRLKRSLAPAKCESPVKEVRRLDGAF